MLCKKVGRFKLMLNIVERELMLVNDGAAVEAIER